MGSSLAAGSTRDGLCSSSVLIDLPVEPFRNQMFDTGLVV